MNASSLPPLRNLPHWTRYPRLFPGDCGGGGGTPRSARRRVASLEKDVAFLQQQHQGTLRKLHEEIDALKRENRELQYRMIMDPHLSSPKEIQMSQPDSQSAKRTHVNQTPCVEAGTLSHATSSSKNTSNPASVSECPISETRAKWGDIISLQPLRIDSPSSRRPRAPSIQECADIIGNLYNTNHLQSQELFRVKSILKDIVINKKTTSPEAYAIAKAHLADNTKGEESDRFQKQPLKPLSQILAPGRPSMADRTVLPSIKQSLGNGMTQRQKRAQALHKTRLRKVINS
uniref:Uncharacterized protein n=1 Tax=Denticeps clupeoides TaxID=299321 RepID=A0AAY4ER41_9TELE